MVESAISLNPTMWNRCGRSKTIVRVRDHVSGKKSIGQSGSNATLELIPSTLFPLRVKTKPRIMEETEPVWRSRKRRKLNLLYKCMHAIRRSKGNYLYMSADETL